MNIFKKIIAGAILIAISSLAIAAGYPYWYQKSYNHVGSVNEINISERYIVISDVKLPLAEKVDVNTVKSEVNPLSIIKKGDKVGVKLVVVGEVPVTRFNRAGTSKTKSAETKTTVRTKKAVSEIWILDKTKPLIPAP